MKHPSTHYIESSVHNTGDGRYVDPSIVNALNIRAFEDEGIMLTLEEIIFLAGLFMFHDDEETLIITGLKSEIRIGAIEVAQVDFLHGCTLANNYQFYGIARTILDKLVPEAKGKEVRLKFNYKNSKN